MEDFSRVHYHLGGQLIWGGSVVLQVECEGEWPRCPGRGTGPPSQASCGRPTYPSWPCCDTTRLVGSWGLMDIIVQIGAPFWPPWQQHSLAHNGYPDFRNQNPRVSNGNWSGQLSLQNTKYYYLFNRNSHLTLFVPRLFWDIIYHLSHNCARHFKPVTPAAWIGLNINIYLRGHNFPLPEYWTETGFLQNPR